jgi:hypothetical protein
MPEPAVIVAATWRADERIRTAFLLQLRVIGQALLRVAQVCKSRIFKGFSFLCLAESCTVLRSRWCQSGVRSMWITCRRLVYKPYAQLRYFRRAMSE